LDATTVTKEMRQNGRFQKSEFLSEKQVESFWSRQAAKRRQQEPITYYTENQEEICEEEVFDDPAFYDSHLEMESNLFTSDCFEAN